ncbi:MAG: type II toxin-antitoxin system HipA family toxin [Streptosporangiaceae bacterium]
MTYHSTEVIEVRAWGRLVGAVALDPGTGWYAFAFADDWVTSRIELAPLHMPLRSEPYEFPNLSRDTFYGLPPMLADSLPDAFGNALVDAWMAEHGVASDEITPLDRLAYAAHRAMGALVFRPPADGSREEPTAVQLADLVLAARRTVRGEFAGDVTAQAALQQLIQVGTSAGGARAKAVVSFRPDTYQIRSAYDDRLPEGFEHWLIKLDGVDATGLDGHGDRLGESAPYGRIECAYAKMATAAGVEMSRFLLLAEGPRRHFMTKRFDRGPALDGVSERIHMISLCALAHLDYNMIATHSYDQYFDAVEALHLGPDAMAQAYRRMVFNVAAVNHDDHTKNFAFLRRESGDWELAPAYDVTHAYRPGSHWTSRHLMAVNGKFADISLADLYEVGERNRVPGYMRVVREVQKAVDDWPLFAGEVELDGDTTQAIQRDLVQFRPR